MDKEIKDVSILQLSYGNYVLLDDYIDLQQRIDKAVESIEDCKKVNGDKKTCIIDHNYLLNILKGGDTNE